MFAKFIAKNNTGMHAVCMDNVYRTRWKSETGNGGINDDLARVTQY